MLTFLKTNGFWNVNPSARTLRAEIVALHMPSVQYSIQKLQHITIVSDGRYNSILTSKPKDVLT